VAFTSLIMCCLLDTPFFAPNHQAGYSWFAAASLVFVAFFGGNIDLSFFVESASIVCEFDRDCQASNHENASNGLFVLICYLVNRGIRVWISCPDLSRN